MTVINIYPKGIDYNYTISEFIIGLNSGPNYDLLDKLFDYIYTNIIVEDRNNYELINKLNSEVNRLSSPVKDIIECRYLNILKEFIYSIRNNRDKLLWR